MLAPSRIPRRKRLLEPSEITTKPFLATPAKASVCSDYSCFCHRRQRPSRSRPSKSTCNTLKKPRGDFSRSHAPGNPSSRVPQALRPSEGTPEAPTRSDVDRAFERVLYKSRKRAICTVCTLCTQSLCTQTGLTAYFEVKVCQMICYRDRGSVWLGNALKSIH